MSRVNLDCGQTAFLMSVDGPEKPVDCCISVILETLRDPLEVAVIQALVGESHLKCCRLLIHRRARYLKQCGV